MLAKYINSNKLKHNWELEEISNIYNQTFNDLVFAAQSIHRKHFNPNEIQLSSLLSIKTGNCPEDCSYCSQSVRYKTDITKEDLLTIKQVIDKAKQAKSKGIERFCMGAAWKNPNKKNMGAIIEMIKEVKKLGLETCMTLGMLSTEQSQHLATAGLDYYNHNIDTSEEFYSKIVSTHSFEDRLNTISNVRKAGIKVCSGGILGLGESSQDRISFLHTLANLSPHPESVPINKLVAIEGTPLAKNNTSVEHIEFVKIIAVARILIPKSYIRLSAGRESMDDTTQALCFMAGANSIFYGEQLLTSQNNAPDQDQILFRKLGINSHQKKCQEPLHYNANK